MNPKGVTGPFQLYRRAGSKNDAPIEVPGVSFAGLQPEVLSDDGTREVRGVPCKDLPVDQLVFRSLGVSF